MVAELDLCSDGPDPAGVGINDSATDCDASGEAKFASCFLAEGTA